MSNLNGVFGGSFDVASNYEEEPSFELLPDLDAVLMIVDATVKDTQAGGMGINMQIEIIQDITYQDKHKGRKVFDWINIAHPTSEVAVNIGKATLSRYAVAVGLNIVDDTSQLLNKPFAGKISRRKDKKTGEERQVINGVKPLQQTQAPQQTQPPAQQQEAAAQQPQQPFGQPAQASPNPFAQK